MVFTEQLLGLLAAQRPHESTIGWPIVAEPAGKDREVA
jgi:hypothetical protein